MSEHRYILEPYKGMSSRYTCPSCNHKRTISRYIDTTTGDYISSEVGRCNHETHCGYHYTPKQYFQDNNIPFDSLPSSSKIVSLPPPKPVSFIPVELFKASLKNYKSNNFVMYLKELFGLEITENLIKKYNIGTSKHWEGSTVFWQIDTLERIHTGKIMLYDATNGKRVREPFNHITWVHKALKMSDYELKQCLFGEHLLKDQTKPIAIVESEKTAIIASVYLPSFSWLAVGSLTNLNVEKCRVLKGRTVVLYPDLSAFEKWSTKAKELGFKISNLLESEATEAERMQALDLADFLIKLPYKNPDTPPLVPQYTDEEWQAFLDECKAPHHYPTTADWWHSFEKRCQKN
jgi:hypothetical protein